MKSFHRAVLAVVGCMILGVCSPHASAVDIITTVAGNGANTDYRDGIPATQASLTGFEDSGNSVAVDANGIMYVVDPGGARVRKVALDGTITTIAGTGTVGFSGDGGPATAATLMRPVSVAVDNSNGDLYIADKGDHRIRKVASDGTISTFAGDGYVGPGGRGRFQGDGGLATAASLDMPLALFVYSGTLYIADAGNGRVRHVDIPTGMIGTMAGGGGPSPGFGDGGMATAAMLQQPSGLWVTAGGLYIADRGLNRVRMVSGGYISNVAGRDDQPPGFAGDGGVATSATLNGPTGVAVDSAGNVYIADAWNRRVRVVTAADGIINTFSGNGTGAFSGDGGPAAQASLGQPIGIAVDGADNVYIADDSSSRVRVVDKVTGNIATKAGNGSGAFAGDGGPALNASFTHCQAMAADGTGNMYVADTDNFRVRKIDPSGVITTVAGNGTNGFAGDGGAATNAAFSWVGGIAVDKNGDLYIVDADNGRVRRVSMATGIINTIAGGGMNNPNGGGPATSVQLPAPVAIAVDGGGNVFISNQGFIYRVDGAGAIAVYAGNGQPPGSPVGDNGPATQARLLSIVALALDGNGNLYVVDEDDARVRKIAPDGTITTVAGMGTRGFSGDGAQAVQAQLSHPQCVAVDGGGNVFISDTANRRVRKVDPSGVISAFAGTGALGYSGDGGDALQATLYWPAGIVATKNGVFVSDPGANRVRRVRRNTPPVINGVAISQNPVKTNTDVTFTATVTDADGDPLTYTWTSDAGVGGSSNPVTLQFPVAGTFTGTLTVSDGYETTTSSGTITVVAPPSTSAGVTNVDQGQTPVENPLNGITIQVFSSDGGIVELAVDIQALIRADFEAATDFSDVPGRGATAIRGSSPVHQYVQTGVFVATSNAIEVATGQSKGKARKTLAISRKETGQDQLVAAEPTNRAIKTKSLKGKFIFKSPKPKADLVSFSGTIALGSGLDLSKAQEIALGVGNITDSTMVDPKGRGTAPGTQGHIKKLSVKYPKLKGTTLTKGGETATVSMTLSMNGMSPAGFDTEGVTPEATDVNSKGVAARSIQVAVVLAGVSYEVSAPTDFKLSAKKDAGQLLPSRSGR